MTARTIDGKATAARVRERVAVEVGELADHGAQPGLAAVLIGDDPASQVYVAGKQRDCDAVGIAWHGTTLPAEVTGDDLRHELDRLNQDPAVSGIIVQLPLPAHLDPVAAQERIDPAKDVDGLGPVNAGRLLRGDPLFVPATPLGCQTLLAEHDVPLEGAHVVILGRSQLVGRPLAMLLNRKAQGANATVTMCHTRTRDVAAHTRTADVVVVATGVPGSLTADMLRPGAAVIDVGINRAEDGSLYGDVDPDVWGVAGAVTPVPGGVGPMTRAMLLHNTVRAARAHAGLTPA